MLKILFFYPDHSGSAFYRVLLPASKLEKEHHALVGTTPAKGGDPEAVYRAVKASDVIVLSRTTSPHMAEQMRAMQRVGKVFVVDMDDDFFNLSPYSPHYETLGTAEVNHVSEEGESVPLWQNGENIDIEKNRETLLYYVETWKQADLITVSTDHLASVYEKYAPVKVLKNSIDFGVWRRVRVRYPGDEIRLGWRGGWSHYEDLMWAKPAIKRLLEAHANLKLVMIGWCPKAWAREFRDRIEVYPWVPNELYPHVMISAGIDVAICPWKPIDFNKGKSEIAFTEWSALAVAGVYPAVSPFTDIVRHNETGCLAYSEQGFFEEANKLINDRLLRTRIGQAARAFVEERFDVDKNISQWKGEYENLWFTKSRDLTDQTENSPSVLH